VASRRSARCSEPGDWGIVDARTQDLLKNRIDRYRLATAQTMSGMKSAAPGAAGNS
jgi:hypothetical protein